MTDAASRSRATGRYGAMALGLVLIALGIESSFQMMVEWTNDGTLTLATGLLLLVGGTGVLVGSRRSLGMAAWSLRVQLAVTIVITVLAVWAQLSAASVSGRLPIAPVAGVLAVGGLYAATCVGALVWIRRARAIAPSGRGSDGDGVPPE